MSSEQRIRQSGLIGKRGSSLYRNAAFFQAHEILSALDPLLSYSGPAPAGAIGIAMDEAEEWLHHGFSGEGTATCQLPKPRRH